MPHNLFNSKKSPGRLIGPHRLLAHLDESLTLDGPMPATSNRIEGGASSPIRQMLREHRGMSLMRRIKAVFWWCCMNCDYRLSPAQTLKVMPTDDEITEIRNQLTRTEELAGSIPRWGDAIMWNELHMIDYSHQSFRHDRD